MKKTMFWFVVGMLVLSILACAGGTSGSVIGSGQNCSAKGSQGSCEGTFKTLNGSISEEYETGSLSGNNVDVQASFSVDDGQLKVYIKDDKGNQTTAELKPGSPATLKGAAEVSFDKFKVYFEAVDGKASGIQYKINYQEQ
jgi:hypothetical protein